jgi:hypothetical protein
MILNRNYFINIIIVLGLLLFFSVRSSIAEEINFEVSADRNVIMIGQGLNMQIKFSNSKNVPALRLPDIEGFRSRYIGPSTSMSIVNGRIASSVTHIYSLVPLKTGKFNIGPFGFDHKGNTYKSNTLMIEVKDSLNGGENAGRDKGSGQAINDRISVVMEADRSKAYLNEMIPLTIKLYIDGLSVRDIEYPVFEHDGISVDQFKEPRQYQERKGGRVHDVIEFSTIMFATRSGNLSIGPARIKSSLMIQKQRRRSQSAFNGFFDRDIFGYEKHSIELLSEPLSLNILPLPRDGRPDDFRGAVGKFRMSVESSPSEVSAGDPVTLKLSITGEGNFDTVTSPVLKREEGFKIYEPQVTKSANKKVFEHVLIPRAETITRLPDLYFSFFDPEEGKYTELIKKDLPLKVLKPQKDEELMVFDAPQSAKKRPARETLGRDIIYIKGSPGKFRTAGAYLYKNPIFYIINVIPLLLLISLWILKKEKARLSSDVGYARRLLAPKKAKRGMDKAAKHLGRNEPDEFYDAVSKTLREYLGNRFHLSSGGMTVDIVDTALRNKDIDQEMLQDIKTLFNECDIARYSSKEHGTAEMEATLTRLREVINYCEQIKQ